MTAGESKKFTTSQDHGKKKRQQRGSFAAASLGLHAGAWGGSRTRRVALPSGWSKPCAVHLALEFRRVRAPFRASFPATPNLG